jgi:hypothetical protein
MLDIEKTFFYYNKTINFFLKITIWKVAKMSLNCFESNNFTSRCVREINQGYSETPLSKSSPYSPLFCFELFCLGKNEDFTNLQKFASRKLEINQSRFRRYKRIDSFEKILPIVSLAFLTLACFFGQTCTARHWFSPRN